MSTYLPPNQGPRHLRLDGQCPHCRRSYDLHRLKVLAEHDQRVLAYIDCTHCGSAILSLLTVSPTGLSAIGLLTDLQSDEVLDSDARQTVTPNDVLDLHTFVDRDEAAPLDLIST